MSSSNPKPAAQPMEQLDVVVLREIYPDAAAVFQRGLVPLNEIKNDCIVVLDTNELLRPYIASPESLAEIKRTYEQLISKDSLFVPGQVAREFAKHRANKLTDIYKKLLDKKSLKVDLDPGKYPLLNDLPDYKTALEISKEISEKVKEYQKAIGLVIDHIADWLWDDPVSSVYAELFNDKNVCNASISDEDFEADRTRRQINNIPPGFKDKGNGDLLIWHTILELGSKKQKHLIFVSGDEKADWQHQTNGGALYPRYELVDEYRRSSKGKSFHIVRLSNLLKLYGATAEVVEEVQNEESAEAVLGFSSPRFGSDAESALMRWILRVHPMCKIHFGMKRLDLVVETQEGRKIGVQVRAQDSYFLTREFLDKVEAAYIQGGPAIQNGEIDALLVCVMCRGTMQADEVLRLVRNERIPGLIGAKLWTGIIDNHDQFIPVSVSDPATL